MENQDERAWNTMVDSLKSFLDVIQGYRKEGGQSEDESRDSHEETEEEEDVQSEEGEDDDGSDESEEEQIEETREDVRKSCDENEGFR